MVKYKIITGDNHKRKITDELEKEIKYGEQVQNNITSIRLIKNSEATFQDILGISASKSQLAQTGDKEELPSIIETPPPSPDEYMGQTFEDAVDTSENFIGPGYYFCLYCRSNGFKHKCCLGRHFRQDHLNIRPFQCKICDWAYDTQRNLGQHLLSHMEEPTLKCNQCKTVSGRELQLEDTEGIISTKRKCVILKNDNRTTSSMQNYCSLERHLKIVHGIKLRLTEEKSPTGEEYCTKCQNIFRYEHSQRVAFSECGHISCLHCVINAGNLRCEQCTTQNLHKKAKVQ